MNKRRTGFLLITLILTLSLVLTGCEYFTQTDGTPITDVPANVVIGGEKIPAFTSNGYYVVNGNQPFFTDEEITTEGFYEYTDLDTLGRAGMAWGSIGPETLPEDEREDINHIYPSGWKYNGKSNNNKYDASTGVNTYIYNRAHLLANQLVSDDVDERNFFTGTCDMNQKHMVRFENMVADYVKEDGGHVMYRVTPYFEGQNLICSGVLMEGYSVEDEGDSVLFCVFIYNVQPGIYINYLTGENCLASEVEGGGETNACTHTNTEIKDAIAPTCGKDGYSGDTWCKDCITKIADGTVIGKTNEHIFGDFTDVTGTNAEARTCESCGETETRVKPYKENTAYKLTGTFDTVRYFSGSATTTSSGGLNTTTDLSLAADVYIEAVTEVTYYLYFYVDDHKSYISTDGSKTTSLYISDKGVTEWTINEMGYLTAGGRTLGCYSGEYFRYYASVSEGGQYRPLKLIEAE